MQFFKPNGKSRQSGFTLTELLVVIAIIAVLAAIIFALLPRMKSASHSATCVSNQRQIVNGMVSWIQENNNKMPEYIRLVPTGGGYYWYAQMTRDASSPIEHTLPYAPHKPLRPGEEKGLWVCPANDAFKTPSTTKDISYAYNGNCFSTAAQSKSFMQMSDPVRTIAICDMSFPGPNAYRILSDSDIGHVHKGGTIAAFWDGHAQLLNPVPAFDSRAFQFTDD